MIYPRNRRNAIIPILALLIAFSLIGCSHKQQPAQGQTVYVTDTGECYHRASCSSLRYSKHPISLKEARQDYRPCSRCRPPK